MKTNSQSVSFESQKNKLHCRRETNKINEFDLDLYKQPFSLIRLTVRKGKDI